ncbi:MAG: cyclic nucleotide-binding domain-containing protein [Polyangiaceae bacterium]
MRAELQPSQQVERIIALRRFPGFVNLRPSEIAAIAAFTQEQLFPSGTALTKPGRPVQSIFFIVEGQVNYYEDGEFVRQWGPHDVIGGMAAMTQDPAGQHFVAADDVIVFEVAYEDMLDVFEDHFGILVAVLGGMSRGMLQARRELGLDGGYEPPVNPETPPHSLPRLTLVEKILFLRNLQDMGRHEVEVMAELARGATEWRYDAGTSLWSAGDSSDYYLFIIAGCVRGDVPAEPAGDQGAARPAQRIRLGANSPIGIMDALAGVPRWYTAVAETDVVVLRVEVGDLIDILEDHTELAVNMLRGLSASVLELRRRIGQKARESLRAPAA